MASLITFLYCIPSSDGFPRWNLVWKYSSTLTITLNNHLWKILWISKAFHRCLEKSYGYGPWRLNDFIETQPSLHKGQILVIWPLLLRLVRTIQPQNAFPSTKTPVRMAFLCVAWLHVSSLTWLYVFERRSGLWLNTTKEWILELKGFDLTTMDHLQFIKIMTDLETLTKRNNQGIVLFYNGKMYPHVI